jgi:hypothetical protein
MRHSQTLAQARATSLGANPRLATGSAGGRRSCNTDAVCLEALQAWTAERKAGLNASGIEVALTEPSTTPKPAQWLTLRTPTAEAEIGLWISGECETAIGRLPADPSDPSDEKPSRPQVGVRADPDSGRPCCPDHQAVAQGTVRESPWPQHPCPQQAQVSQSDRRRA